MSLRTNFFALLFFSVLAGLLLLSPSIFAHPKVSGTEYKDYDFYFDEGNDEFSYYKGDEFQQKFTKQNGKHHDQKYYYDVRTDNHCQSYISIISAGADTIAIKLVDLSGSPICTFNKAVSIAVVNNTYEAANKCRTTTDDYKEVCEGLANGKKYYCKDGFTPSQTAESVVSQCRSRGGFSTNLIIYCANGSKIANAQAAENICASRGGIANRALTESFAACEANANSRDACVADILDEQNANDTSNEEDYADINIIDCTLKTDPAAKTTCEEKNKQTIKAACGQTQNAAYDNCRNKIAAANGVDPTALESGAGSNKGSGVIPTGTKMQVEGVLGGPEDIGLPRVDPQELITNTIIPLLYTLVGAISVIVILVGALRFTIARGDPGSIKSARDTIIYGLIGLALAVLAFTIVSLIGSISEGAI